MRIESIKIGERHRKDYGDITTLAKSIDEIGLLHPVVVTPEGVLIAGARRLRACQMLGWTEIPATVVSLESIVRGEHDENALRKDFTPSEAVAIAEALEPMEREAAKERQRSHTESGYEKFTDPAPALDKVASVVGMSRPTLTKAREVIRAAEQDPERFGDLVEQMDETGKVDRAHQMYKRRTIADRMQAIDLPPKKYRILYADPPWKYNDSGAIGETDNYGRAERHYPTMSITELCALSVKELADDNAVLFLWTTSPLLEECFAVIKAWGFQYKTSFVWDKVAHNFGHYNSVRHEFLLVCTRGSCTPDNPKLFDSVQSIEKTRTHSEKPEEFRNIIDTLYPHGRRIELFARRPAPNWDIWGNEI